MFRRLREKLSRGLRKTRHALGEQFAKLPWTGRKVDQALLDDLEEVLITADLGVETASRICEDIALRARGRAIDGLDEVLELVRESMATLMPDARDAKRPEDGPRITLVVGVNGSGKTTTTGKLAARWAKEGRQVVVAAADTFRAAAVEQLAVWAERAGARVVRATPGADPAAVAFDAVEAGRAAGVDEVLIDTAGRLHNKKPLMDELAKISRVVAKGCPGAPHETLLVLDGTTGRNAIHQAREFNKVAPVTGLVLSKLDGTAKGGVAVAIGSELHLPVRYIGVGEGADDLLDFDLQEYIAGLLTPVDRVEKDPGRKRLAEGS